MAKRSFYIKESELDDHQVLVLQRRVDKPSIVKGCAGSGKSILALHRVKQIQDQNIGSFYFILFTKALKQYMQDGIDSIGLNNDRIVYHQEWKNMGAPNADFIIIDETQDFSKEDIQLFQSKANKSLIMFGDSAQQIYRFRLDNPLTIEDIASITGIPTYELSYNHRLPKKIARLAKYISESDDELEFRCKNEGNELPKILEFNSLYEQFDKIIEIIRNRNFDDVGILLQTNNDVEYAKNYFESHGMEVEAKFNNSMDLNFDNDLPKLTTYHSSKGLQFEAVFIPNCENIYPDNQSALYVAITRTYQSLFIMHSGNLTHFFDDVPKELYETTLTTSRTSRRV